VTDISGVSARAMLEAILAGERDVEALADLARGRLRAKRDQLKEALEGRVTAHHGPAGAFKQEPTVLNKSLCCK
jgi:transposase